jgi:glycosyl transferase family 25
MTAGRAMKLAVRVISLPGDEERRSRFIEGSVHGRLPWSFLDADTSLAPGLQYLPLEALKVKGRLLTAGELGCYSSHYKAWRWFADSDCDHLLVLEDDVVLDWVYAEWLIRCNGLTKVSGCLRLFAKAPAAHIVRGEICGRYLLEFSNYASGAQAYFLDRPAAHRLLEHCAVVTRPLDDELDRSWSHGVRNFCVFPFPAFERASISRIGLRPPTAGIPIQRSLQHGVWLAFDHCRRALYATRRRVSRGAVRFR